MSLLPGVRAVCERRRKKRRSRDQWCGDEWLEKVTITSTRFLPCRVCWKSARPVRAGEQPFNDDLLTTRGIWRKSIGTSSLCSRVEAPIGYGRSWGVAECSGPGTLIQNTASDSRKSGLRQTGRGVSRRNNGGSQYPAELEVAGQQENPVAVIGISEDRHFSWLKPSNMVSSTDTAIAQPMKSSL